MKELEWNRWCLCCELCRWAGNWRKRLLTMYFKAYPSYFVFSYNYPTRILFLFQFRAEAAKLIISLYIKYKCFFISFFPPTYQERRNTLVLFCPFLGRFWLSSQERMCVHLSRCVHTGGAHWGLENVSWIPWAGLSWAQMCQWCGTGQTGSLEG